MNLNISYQPEFEQIVCKMPAPAGAHEKLAAAITAGTIKAGYYGEWIGPNSEPGEFFDALVEIDGEHCHLMIEDDGQLRFSVGARNANGVDHTDFRPDMDGSWIEFVQPVRRILQILN